MKTFIILGLIFTAVNSSFLRELDTAVTISGVTFGATTCTTTATVTISADTGATTTFESSAVTGKLSSGVTANDITLTNGVATKAVTDPSAANGKIDWTLDPANAKTGVYKLTTVSATGATFTIADTVTTNLTISTDATHDNTQTGLQEIEEGKTFEVKFNPAPAKVPLLYVSSTATAPILECSQNATDTKQVLCKPTADEMDGDTEYTIHYKNGCTDALVATAVKVKVKFTPEDSSAFITFGKIALLAVALLF